jgi:hypothetical protein
LNGFTPFPLSPMAKVPNQGTPLSQVQRLPFVEKTNIGIFAGSDNGLAIIDADVEVAREMIPAKLAEMGLLDWVTIVRTPNRDGRHYWIRLTDKPNGAQAYYKLSQMVGGGEFRVNRPAYVVAPGSRTEKGEYTFVQGGIEYFCGQPGVSWTDLLWLAPTGMAQAGKAQSGSVSRRKVSDPPAGLRRIAKPKVLALVDLIHGAGPDGRVRRIDYATGRTRADYFDTRSEAEAALVTGLVLAGWSFDNIEELFEREQPEHYTSVPRPDYYLTTTYNKGVRYISSRLGNKQFRISRR